MSIVVLRGALGANLQDQGRYGYQHLGIPPGGPMDRHALEKGQAILGNAPHTAAIECCFPAPVFFMEKACFLVITGADLGPVLEWQEADDTLSMPLSLDRPAFVPAGTTLRFTQQRMGNYAYLSIQGGFELDEWLGSNSTNLMAEAGGHAGRFLQKGDRLFFQQNEGKKTVLHKDQKPRSLSWWAAALRPAPSGEFAFLPGTDLHRLDKTGWQALTTEKFTLTTECNRMGFRLRGPTLNLLPAAPRWSAAVVRGSMQCLPDGQLIVLMADHQTTGGYPVVGVLTPSATDALAQWPIGQSFAFQNIDPAEAEANEWATSVKLHQLKIACTFPFHENH